MNGLNGIARERDAEISKYRNAYRSPAYAMGDKRRDHVNWLLKDHIPHDERRSLLDVSTGRGEVLTMARAAGFKPVFGTEAVEYLADGPDVVHCLAHEIPFKDNSFHIVTMFDVMEHLLPEDTQAVCQELARVASHRVVVTVCNRPSSFKGGEPLHINLRESYEHWFAELQVHFAPHTVNWLDNRGSISEMFEIIKNG